LINPEVREFLLNGVCPKSIVQICEINEIEVLVLIEAREDEDLLVGYRVDMPLEALGANLFHHALHR
jgi:hypothetical protein